MRSTSDAQDRVVFKPDDRIVRQGSHPGKDDPLPLEKLRVVVVTTYQKQTAVQFFECLSDTLIGPAVISGSVETDATVPGDDNQRIGKLHAQHLPDQKVELSGISPHTAQVAYFFE